MGKLRRKDVQLLAALDRAIAFDHTAERARDRSPSVFPPEITCQKYLLDDGVCEHVFHHRALGELGRLRIQDRDGRSHISGVISGYTDDPLHDQRDALFRPLMEEFARANNQRCVQSKHLPCARCGVIAASIIFIDGSAPDDFDTCARLMYPEYSRSAAPTWIIGPPVGGGPEPERAADILKIWPTREPLRRLRPNEFNPICDRFVVEHCSRKIRQPGVSSA